MCEPAARKARAAGPVGRTGVFWPTELRVADDVNVSHSVPRAAAWALLPERLTVGHQFS